MVLKKAILRYTNYNQDIFGNGGDKRSMQIFDILKNANYNVINIKFDKSERSTITFYFKIKCIIFGGLLKLWHWGNIRCNLKEIANAGWLYQNINKELIHYQNITNILIWEDTKGLSILIPYIAKKKNFRIIAVPHNFESLVYNQSKKVVFSKLKNEVNAYKLAESVYSISFEDNWLLSIFKVNTFYLPYCPPTEYIPYLEDIALVRRTKKNKHYLILSTFWGATENGIIDLLKVINNNNINEYFIVAGFNTEEISKIINLKNNIKLFGTVDFNTLKDLMIETKALIINQNASSGLLTRIPEFLISDIPIIANLTAVRSFYNIKGITIYSNYNDLIDILKNSSFETRIEYKYEIKFENFFVNDINHHFYKQ